MRQSLKNSYKVSCKRACHFDPALAGEKSNFLSTSIWKGDYGISSLLIVFVIFLCQNLYPAEKSPGVGFEYQALLRGQMITEKDVPSHELNHILKLKIIPLQYLNFSIWAGMQKFSVDTYNSTKFESDFGFTPGGSLGLLSPGFFKNHIWITVGSDVLYLNSEESGYEYEGPITDIFGGCKFAVARNVEIEAGGRAHFIVGTIRNTRTSEEYGSFSNRNIIRGYGILVLKSMEEKVNFSLYFDASPEFSKDWANGPCESSLGASIGFMIVPDTKTKKIEQKNKTYFPGLEGAKQRIEEMEKEMKEDN